MGIDSRIISSFKKSRLGIAIFMFSRGHRDGAVSRVCLIKSARFARSTRSKNVSRYFLGDFVPNISRSSFQSFAIG